MGTRVLLLGSRGTLGTYLAQELTDRCDLVTLDRGVVAARTDRDSLHINDIREWGVLRGMIEALKVDVVVNAVAMTSRPEIDQHPSEALEVNGVLPQRLATWGLHDGWRLIHISTDGVFSGHKGPYGEDDLPDPDDNYGVSKLAGEPHLSNSISIRTTFYGFQGRRSLLGWLADQRGATVNGFAGYRMTGLPASRLARIVGRLAQTSHVRPGVYHLPGPAMSKFELLRLVNGHFGFGVDVREIETPPIDRRLIGSALFDALEEPIPQIADILVDLESDRRHYRSSDELGKDVIGRPKMGIQ